MKLLPRVQAKLHKRRILNLGLLAILVTVASSVHAQQPSPNADILKMIEGGLPESVVVNKIREGLGHWDTSVDALLALKKAGATDAELSTLTSVQVAPVTGLAANSAPAEIVEVFGAQLVRSRAGDPYLRFPSNAPGVFPNGMETNTAYLVRFKGEIGVLIPSTKFFGFSANCTAFNAVFLHDSFVIDQYLDDACEGAGRIPKKLTDEGNGFYTFARDGLSLSDSKGFSIMSDDNPPRQAGLRYRNLRFGEGKKPAMNDRVVFGVFPYAFGYESHSDAMYSPLVDPFVDRLMSHFEQTIAEFAKAAGLNDPLSQLSEQATYSGTTATQAAAFEAKMDLRWKMRPKGHGFGLMDLVQGYNATQQMTSGVMNTAVGVSSGNVVQVASGLQSIGTASGSQTFSDAAAQARETQPAVASPSAVPKVVSPAPTTGKSNFSVKPPPSPAAHANFGSSTGTAKPADCVAVDVTKPCIPLAQYTQMQAATANAPVTVNPPTTDPTPWPSVATNANFIGTVTANTHICPTVGHILTGHYAASDVWEGESIPCTPGQQVIITWPAPVIATPPSPPGGSSSGTGAGANVGFVNGVTGFTGGTSCATAPDGSNLALIPGTTAGSCNPAECHDLSLMVTVKSRWKDPKTHENGEVVGTIVNESLSPVTCSTAFHKNGQWTEYGTGYYSSGGKSGAWTVGADNSGIAYVCFEGTDPVDVHGHLCNANLKFTVLAPAGADIYDFH